MDNYIPRPESMDRYDDGVTLDYASMIRMWSAFDRSLSTFNRRCGVPAIKRPAVSTRAGETETGRSKR